VLKDAGYDVTIASPAGGAVPIDDASLQGDFKTPECDRMLNDGERSRKCAGVLLQQYNRSHAKCRQLCI
jgi:hypothetical protein